MSLFTLYYFITISKQGGGVIYLANMSMINTNNKSKYLLTILMYFHSMFSKVIKMFSNTNGDLISLIQSKKTVTDEMDIQNWFPYQSNRHEEKTEQNKSCECQNNMII